MKKFGDVKSAFRLIRVNWKAFVALELVFKLVALVLLVAALTGLTRLSMRLTGYTYLTRENVSAFALHPLIVASGILWLVMAVTWAMIDIGAVAYLTNASNQGVACTVSQALLFAIRTALRAWRPRNLPMVAILLLMTPFFCSGLIMGAAAGLSVPEALSESIRLNKALYVSLLALLLLVSLLLTRRLYAFHVFALEGGSYRHARARCRELNRRWPLNFAKLLAVQLVFGAALILVELLLTVVAKGIGRALSAFYDVSWLQSVLVLYAVVIALVVAAALSLPFTCIWVAALYNRVAPGAANRRRLARRTGPIALRDRIAMRLVMILLLAGAAALLGVMIDSGALNPNIESLRTVEITAHRGASAYYPENTMAAFRGARELGADWVELDVQQTKDGRIIVMHDPNTKRTTGVPGNVWNMTYDEIATLDAGSLFGREFAGERVPLLSEVAEYARQSGLRLNIELKPTGHETDFEQAVVDIVREYGLQERCVITSQVYRVLTNVKACDENITTVYVTSLAYGAIDRLTAADHFSVEATNATRRLVSCVHNSGSQIYAWTVNTRKGINRMIARNVDNIITDNVELARQCVTESRYGVLLSDLVRTLDGEQ